VGGPGVVSGVGSGVGGVHPSGSSVSIHEHSSAAMQSQTSSRAVQKVHVLGEFPAQHPGSGRVGAGGRVFVGGSVGGSHSLGSSVTIHEQTPADSQSAMNSNSLQNEKVRGEYPVQHPTLSVGCGVGSVVGGRHSSMLGSSVGIQLHSAAALHGLSSSKVPQKDHVIGVLPAQQPLPLCVGAGGGVSDGG